MLIYVILVIAAIYIIVAAVLWVLNVVTWRYYPYNSLHWYKYIVKYVTKNWLIECLWFRKIMYRRMLIRFQKLLIEDATIRRERKRSFGFCAAVDESSTVLGSKDLYDYPELLKYKPFKADKWWYEPTDRDVRIKILETIIGS